MPRDHCEMPFGIRRCDMRQTEIMAELMRERVEPRGLVDDDAVRIDEPEAGEPGTDRGQRAADIDLADVLHEEDIDRRRLRAEAERVHLRATHELARLVGRARAVGDGVDDLKRGAVELPGRRDGDDDVRLRIDRIDDRERDRDRRTIGAGVIADLDGLN